ncbi:MAG: EAL domain-containing protein [Gammaproteobacteria bacterium]|nr:EAL domain-containing protein [Gammaproteobacteria bacterium]
MSEKLTNIPYRTTFPILMVSIVMLFSVLAFSAWNDLQKYEERLNQQSHHIYKDLSDNVNDINAVLSGFVALHNTIDIVDAEQFSQYAKEMLRTYPGIHAIKLLTKVDNDYRQVFINQVREAGFPTFEVLEGDHDKPQEWKPARGKPFYFPLTAIEPAVPEKIIELGYDLYSNLTYRNAIDQAIDSGAAVSAHAIKLMNGSNGYIVLKPVYAGRVMPLSTHEKRSQALYIIAVIMQAKDLLVNIDINEGLNVEIYKKNKSSELSLAKGDSLLTARLAPTKNAFVFTEYSFEKILNSDGQSLLLSITSSIGLEVIRLKVVVVIFLLWLTFLFLIIFIVKTHYGNLREREVSLNAWQWEKERADVTLHSLADAVITTNHQGVVEYMNPVAEKLTGWKSDDAKGRGIEDIFKLVNELSEVPMSSPVLECIERGVLKESDGDLSLVHKNGEYNSVDYSIAPMFGIEHAVLGAVLVFQDVGSERMMQKLLTYQATHDDLTGIYNRREFERKMSRAIERVFNYKDHYILLYMDLDQFKVVNDSCGHVAGDLVLRQVTELLAPYMTEKETFARLGGDEFGIILDGYSLDEAKEFSKNILNAVRKYRFRWSNKVFEIGVSIGIVDIDGGMQSIGNVMSYADAACYMAKDMGGNNIQVYQMDDDDYKARKDQMKWVQKITQAFADRRFVLYAQKIVSLREDIDDEHYEILMRMIDDNGDIIEPQEYIIAAERFRTMRDIDRWVIRNSFQDIQKYVTKLKNDSSLKKRNFAINLSGQTVGSNSALEYVKEQLQEFPEIIEYVIFEITETAAISNVSSAKRFIAELKLLGVRFSLDDFGTGVSSFNYLKNLNVDYLKIDGGFVREINADKVDYAMVKSIAHIGNVMGIKTIAEHAETHEICDKLKEMGVDYAQGFCLHEPEALANLV